jgi:DNA polymerase-3 subunit delta'
MTSDRVAHSYLFTGPEGVGKERMARTFFAALQCVEQEAEACGRCSPCERVARGVHPDVTVLEPDGRFIKIAAVRELQKKTRYAPIEGRWKCILVREADRLHETAGNALLKTLEEPAGKTVFVLVSSNPQLLLPTITSRCQRVSFGALSHGDLQGVLTGDHGVAPADAIAAAGMANGSVSAALDALDGDAVQFRSEWLGCIASLGTHAPHTLLEIADEVAGDKARFELHLELLLLWYRDLLLVAGGAALEGVANQDHLETLQRIGSGANVDHLLTEVGLIAESLADRRFNVNARLTLERLLLRLSRGTAMRGA